MDIGLRPAPGDHLELKGEGIRDGPMGTLDMNLD
jgi:hypothetical protein